MTLETLQKTYELKKEARYLLEKQRAKSLQETIPPFFQSILEEGDEVKVSGDFIEFKRACEGYSYKKTFFEVRLRTDWKTETATKIETSVYSSSGNDNWELNRLISVGKGAEIILHSEKEILTAYNSVINTFKDSLRKAREIEYESEKMLKVFEGKLKEEELERVMKEVEGAGIEFKEDIGKRFNSYPSLQTSYNDSIDRIKKIRIVSKTYSKKSASIEVTQQGLAWDHETGKEVVKEYTSTFPKVKMSYMEQFIKDWKEKIKA